MQIVQALEHFINLSIEKDMDKRESIPKRAAKYREPIRQIPGGKAKATGCIKKGIGGDPGFKYLKASQLEEGREGIINHSVLQGAGRRKWL